MKQKDIDFLKKTVKKAGKLALKIQKSGLDVQAKEDFSLITQADLAVQHFLCHKLSKHFKDINYICEEENYRNYSAMQNNGLTAVIDPIDGTATFSMYLPMWCVSVGIYQGQKPLYGFIYSPVSDIFLYNDDQNTYFNDAIVRVNSLHKLDKQSNLFYSSNYQKKYDFVFPGKIRNLGSTALHASLISDNFRNRSVAFIGRSFFWDWAAAIPILEKAGGKICYLSGREIDFNEIINNDSNFVEDVIAYDQRNFEEIQNIFRMRENYPC